MSAPNVYKQAISNNVTLQSYPFPSELGMEAYLMDNPSILKLDNAKYPTPQVIECEMSIEKCANRKSRGRIDMVVRYSDNVFGILELKKEVVDKDALFQLFDYLCEREKIVQQINASDTILKELRAEEVSFVGILIGEYIHGALQKEMPITNIKESELFKEYALENSRAQAILGYTDQISAITLERFKHPHTCEIVVISTPIVKIGIRDTTKYKINHDDTPYGKAKLVHKVISLYVAANKGVSIADLERRFPAPKAIRSLGVFATMTKAKENPTRYYADNSMLIDLGGGVKIATCNQWSKESIDEFVSYANKIPGFTIVPT